MVGLDIMVVARDLGRCWGNFPFRPKVVFQAFSAKTEPHVFMSDLCVCPKTVGLVSQQKLKYERLQTVRSAIARTHKWSQ